MKPVHTRCQSCTMTCWAIANSFFFFISTASHLSVTSCSLLFHSLAHSSDMLSQKRCGAISWLGLMDNTDATMGKPCVVETILSEGVAANGCDGVNVVACTLWGGAVWCFLLVQPWLQLPQQDLHKPHSSAATCLQH